MLQQIVNMQEENMRPLAWEIVALLDENKIKLDVEGRFQPDFLGKPIPGSNLLHLMQHVMMNFHRMAYRSYPPGYLEFLFQLRGYKQQKYFILPIVPPNARDEYEKLEEIFVSYK